MVNGFNVLNNGFVLVIVLAVTALIVYSIALDFQGKEDQK